MRSPYPPSDPSPETARSEAKNDPEQVGTLLPPVFINGRWVRLVVTDRTTPGGIPIAVEICQGPGGVL